MHQNIATACVGHFEPSVVSQQVTLQSLHRSRSQFGPINQAAKIGGLKAAAEIMNYMDNNIEGVLMEQMRDQDEDMATQIQDLMFVFENLIEVDDQGIQKLLRDVPQDALQRALKGADDALREKIFKNMSKRAAEMMRDDLEAMPPIKVSDVETAQKEVLAIARRMADAGEIMLGGGADEFL